MKCIYCNGHMKKGKVPFGIDRKGYHLRLEKVPAWICTQCGEPYFGEETVDLIQNIISSVDKKIEKSLINA
jgi:YgiT-type zinc finger domain-containing protein